MLVANLVSNDKKVSQLLYTPLTSPHFRGAKYSLYTLFYFFIF